MTDYSTLSKEELIQKLISSEQEKARLQSSLQERDQKISQLERSLEDIRNEWMLLRKQHFGRHTEKMDRFLSFVFNEAETITENTPDSQENLDDQLRKQISKIHTDRMRKLPKGKASKKGIPKKNHLKQMDVVENVVEYDFAEEFYREHPNAKLTDDYTFEELIYHGPWMEKRIHKVKQAILPDQTTDEGNYVVVKANEYVRPFWNRCMLSSSLLARTAWMKYGLAVPIIRQAKDYSLSGIPISPQNLSGWLNKSWQDFGCSLFNVMWEDLKKARLVHGDETDFPVLETRRAEHRTHCYVMQASTSVFEEKKMVLFFYMGSRSGKFVKEIFGEGSPDRIMHSDGYQPYFNKNFTNVICMDHVRRKFREGLDTLSDHKEYEKRRNNEPDFAGEKCEEYLNQPAHAMLKRLLRIMDLFGALYDCEKGFSELKLAPEQIREQRQKLFPPIFKEMRELIEPLHVKPSKKGGPVVKLAGSNKRIEEAATFYMNHEKYFENLMEHGDAVLSNQLAENEMRPLALVRKNSLFFETENGAECGMGYLSLIASAQRNNLNPERYMAYAFEQLKNHQDKYDPDFIRTLLPYSKELPESLKADRAQKGPELNPAEGA